MHARLLAPTLACLALGTAGCAGDSNGEASPTRTDAATTRAEPGPPPRPGTGMIAFGSDPDGIFRFEPRNNADVYVLDVRRPSRRVRLTRANGNDFSPAWSPDGRRIVFRSTRDGNDEIYVMRADGTNQHRLTRNPDEDRSPAWSPDGSRIVWASVRDFNLDLWSMDADGSNERRLTEGGGNEYPSWSPDGRRIVFQSFRDGADGEIYVMDAAGENERRLTRNPAPDSFPAWSPDGRWILFASTRFGSSDLFLMRPDGSGVRRLTADAANEAFPAWSPDGKRIAFASDRGVTREERQALPGDVPPRFQLYVMDADGGNVRRLTRGPGSDFLPAWQPGRR
ncbi:MAG TPA: DPP IV N-terminal domain-containing protein [Gaiellaceae bacterium]|nr:DPP IV N-terminal domain-containing protein [Gaiellaceae bacterium]